MTMALLLRQPRPRTRRIDVHVLEPRNDDVAHRGADDLVNVGHRERAVTRGRGVMMSALVCDPCRMNHGEQLRHRVRDDDPHLLGTRCEPKCAHPSRE